MKNNIYERFWAKVLISPESSCWEWTGTKKAGYGRMYPDLRAHRISWELHNGPIKGDLLIRHNCDNKGCVRPDHLCLGTSKQNTEDRNQRGRQAKGASHGSVKLSEAQVLEIKASNLTCRELAEKYKVHRSHIWAILNGKKWSHT